MLIRRPSFRWVHNFESNSFDWNNGGRFEADEARFNVRRSARISINTRNLSSHVLNKPSAKLLDEVL